MYRPILRWPSRDFFAELEPELADGHPIYEMLHRMPRSHRLHARIAKMAGGIEPQVNPSQWFAFAERRALLEVTQVAAAFNIGFENGVLLGRSEASAPTTGRTNIREEKLLLGLRSLLATTSPPSERAALPLLELACAVMRGPPARAGRSRRRSRRSGQPASRRKA
jgi:hypothetical protein